MPGLLRLLLLTPLAVALPLGAQELQLTVQDVTGAVIPGATVVLQPLAGSPVRHTFRTDAAGLARLRVAPGAYTANTSAPGFRETTATLAIPTGGSASQHLTLPVSTSGDCHVCLTLPEPIPLIPSHLSALLPETHRAPRKHRSRLPKVDPADLDPISRI